MTILRRKVIITDLTRRRRLTNAYLLGTDARMAVDIVDTCLAGGRVLREGKGGEEEKGDKGV